MKSLIIWILTIFFFCSHYAYSECSGILGLPKVKDIPELSSKLCLEKLRSKSCRNVYHKIKNEGGDPEERILRCVDEKPLGIEGVEVFKGCSQGGWEFLKNIFVPIGTSIGEGLASVVIGGEEYDRWNSKCSQSKKLKMAIYQEYNDAVPALMRVVPLDLKSLNMVSCELIKKDLEQKRMKLQPQLERLRLLSLNKNNQFTGAEKEYVNFIKRGNVGFDQKSKKSIIDQAKSLLEEKGIELGCYNLEYQSALVCEAVAEVVTIVFPAVSASKASKLAKLAGLEGKAENATSSTRQIISTAEEFERASKLTMAERITAAEELLGRKPLTPDQIQAIKDAHKIGEERGLGAYTQEDKVAKGLKLMRAGFTRKEAEVLLDHGIAGSLSKTGQIAAEAMPAINHSQRIEGERKLGQFAKSGKIADLEAGIDESKLFYDKIMHDAAARKSFFSSDDLGFSHLLQANEGGVRTSDLTKIFRSSLKGSEKENLAAYRDAISVTKKRIKEFEEMAAKSPNDLLKYKMYKQNEMLARLTEEYFATKYPNLVGKDGLVMLEKLDKREAEYLKNSRNKVVQERFHAKNEDFPIVDENISPIFSKEELEKRIAVKMGNTEKLLAEKEKQSREIADTVQAQREKNVRDNAQKEKRANERQALSADIEKRGTTVGSPNQSVRVLGEKYLSEFSLTGNKQMLKDGIKNSQIFYSDIAKNANAAREYFSPTQKGITNLIHSCGNGHEAEKAAAVFKTTLKGTPEEKMNVYKEAISSAESTISEYQSMLKTAKTDSQKDLLKYKIFQTKSLKGELLEDYYGSKYPSKYGDRVDLDAMADVDVNARHAFRHELEIEHKAIEKLGLP